MAGRTFLVISSGLLDQKHMDNMGKAIYLYLWLVDRQFDYNGTVYNGRTITYDDFNKTFTRIPKSTYWEWISRLRDHNYITTTTTGHGLKIRVLNPKKHGQLGTLKEITDETSVKSETESEKTEIRVRKNRDQTSKKPSAQRGAERDITIDTTKDIKSIHSLVEVSDSDPAELKENIKVIYDLYVKNWGKNPNQYKLTKTRREQITRRLKDNGYDMVSAAIVNTSKSDFHMGGGPRQWIAPLEWILKSYENVERLAYELGGDGKVSGKPMYDPSREVKRSERTEGIEYDD